MNWMRSFFKVFHTSRCVFSVLLFAQELRNEERHSRLFGREEVEEPGFRWISNRVVGEESYLGTLMPTFFRFFFSFFATSADVRDFSVRITWRETQWPRVEWVIYFLKRYTSFFFFSSSFPFLNASYEGYVPFADTDVQSVEEISLVREEKKIGKWWIFRKI